MPGTCHIYLSPLSSLPVYGFGCFSAATLAHKLFSFLFTKRFPSFCTSQLHTVAIFIKYEIIKHPEVKNISGCHKVHRAICLGLLYPWFSWLWPKICPIFPFHFAQTLYLGCIHKEYAYTMTIQCHTWQVPSIFYDLIKLCIRNVHICPHVYNIYTYIYIFYIFYVYRNNTFLSPNSNYIFLLRNKQ